MFQNKQLVGVFYKVNEQRKYYLTEIGDRQKVIVHSKSCKTQLVSSPNKLFVSLVNKLAIMTTNASALLPSQQLGSLVG